MTINIHKFGGSATENVAQINELKFLLKKILKQDEKNILVFSAQKGDTRSLNSMYVSVSNGNFGKAGDDFKLFFVKHNQNVEELFIGNKNYPLVKKGLNILFKKLWSLLFPLNWNKVLGENYHRANILQYGELINTFVLSNYLYSSGIYNKQVDARSIIKTSSLNKDGFAKIKDFPTSEAIKSKMIPLMEALNSHSVVIVEGFIGRSLEGNNVTVLDYDGSDVTASAIFCLLKAENLTLWKDVDGIYNNDPKIQPKTHKRENLSIEEVKEILNYGNFRVVHPDCLEYWERNSKRREIRIRSFNSKDPRNLGTLIV